MPGLSPSALPLIFSLHLLHPLHAQAYNILHLLFLAIYSINSSSATTLGVSPMPIKFHTTQQPDPGNCFQLQLSPMFLGLVSCIPQWCHCLSNSVAVLGPPPLNDLRHLSVHCLLCQNLPIQHSSGSLSLPNGPSAVPCPGLLVAVPCLALTMGSSTSSFSKPFV